MSEYSIKCRMCGACCTAPSISSDIPGYGGGKPAGERCLHLDQNNSCMIYEERPAVCREFSPTAELCGNNFHEAMERLTRLEEETRP